MSRKRILLLVLGLLLIGAGIGISLWNKPHENMQSSRAEASLDAAALFKAFNDDEEAANGSYLGKTVAVSGKVKEVSNEPGSPIKITLETGEDFGVVCELDALSKHPKTDFKPGEGISLKGKCDGLNFDVQLSRCVVVSQ
jgi:hypothetical protein